MTKESMKRGNLNFLSQIQSSIPFRKCIDHYDFVQSVFEELSRDYNADIALNGAELRDHDSGLTIYASLWPIYNL